MLDERIRCLFHEVHGENDIGNDAILELTEKGQGTGCCVAAQIKSGSSFKARNHYFFAVDDRHRAYWQAHIMPMVGIVYDPEIQRAVWGDLTAWTQAESISTRFVIPRKQILDPESFAEFRTHFIGYQERFSSFAMFGQAMERFACSTRDDVFSALRALFVFHRNRPATWSYICQSLRRLERLGLADAAVGVLRFVVGHGDVYWTERNELAADARSAALLALRENICEPELLVLLGAIDEDQGISRGSIGQDVHAIVDLGAQATTQAIVRIVMDQTVDSSVRWFALLMAVVRLQDDAVEDALALISEYRRVVEPGEGARNALELRKHLLETGYLHLY